MENYVPEFDDSVSQTEALCEYPYVDENGNVYDNLVRHYSAYGSLIRQEETGELFEEAVDEFPCLYHYYETGISIVINDSGDIVTNETI